MRLYLKKSLLCGYDVGPSNVPIRLVIFRSASIPQKCLFGIHWLFITTGKATGHSSYNLDLIGYE